MKGYNSNSKVVFAYQTKESDAAAINTALNPNADNQSVVRVISPKVDPGQAVQTHHDNNSSGTGWEKSGSDSLVGVAISRVLVQSINGDTTYATNNSVRSITRVQSSGIAGELFDIQLTTSLDNAISSNTTKLYKIVIELYFASGDTEDLILNLKQVSKCKLNINPADVRLGGQFTATVNNESLDNSFVAYSISKGYRSLKEKLDSSNDPTVDTRKLYSIGYSGYTPFSAPFGVIYDDVKNLPTNFRPAAFAGGLPTTTYINNGDGFASSKTSHFTWFSGKSDLTRLRIPTTEISQSVGVSGEEDSMEVTGGIDLSTFFMRTLTVHDYNPGESFTYLSRILPESQFWGQTFGWFSTLVKGDIVDSTNEITVVPENGKNFGVPPIYRENAQAANVSSLGVDRPTNFWGAFGAGPSAADGVFIQSFQTLNTGVQPPLNNDPTEVRYSKLLHGSNLNVPGTTMPTQTITGTLEESLHSFLSNYDLTSTRNYLCYYPNAVLSGTGFQSQWQDFGSSMRAGSVINLQTNPGTNFFYPGCAGSAADPLVPVFKGIARVSNVIRFSNEGNLGGITRRIINSAQAASQDFNSLDLNAIWLAGLGTLNPQTGSWGMNKFNNIDLVNNLIFSGHTYPSQPTGFLVNQQSKHLPIFQNSPGMMELWRYGLSALTSELQLGDGIAIESQDIAFLNSVFAPDLTNVINPITDSSVTDSYSPIARNHPIGHALSARAFSGNLIPDYQHFQSAVSENTWSPFAFTSRSFHSDFGENATTPMPPYPYAPHNYLTTNQKACWKNYAAATSGGAASLSYFNTTVSNGNGVTIANSSITAPAAIDTINTIVKSGGAGEDTCFSIFSSTVKLIGAGDADLTQSVTQGNSQCKIEFRMEFFNGCSNGFTKSDGTKVTVGADVATRVIEALEIFPHIEYRPLVMLSAQPEENPFAYKVIVQDANDVDDISITATGVQDLYVLTITMTADSSDIIEINGQDEAVPFGDVWGDIPYPGELSTDAIVTPPFSKRYLSAEGDTGYSGFKGSFMTVASSDAWETFTMLPDSNDGSNNSHSDDVDYQLAYHHPFVTFGNPITENDVVISVYGCTNPAADNYNPNANVDDGSCEDCQTQATDGAWDITVNGLGISAFNAMRPGVYAGSNNVPGAYVYGLVGGNITPTTYGVPNIGNNVYFTSPGAVYGGAIGLDNDYAGQTANGYLSIKGKLLGAGLSDILSYLQTQGEDHTAWNLKIKAFTDTILNDNAVVFGDSYSASNPVPAVITNAPALYNATATGGTIYEPTWDDIMTPTSPLPGLLAGVPYILELQLDPKSLGLACTAFNDNNNVILGIMWTTFCACSNPTNDYFFTAMNGATYPWQQNGTSAFPVISYSSGDCPDSINPNILNGDSPYPQNICFTPDAALSDCDQYWLYCLADTAINCASTINSLEDAYPVGNNYFFDYTDVTITTHIEGVYNSTADGFIWDPNIEYIVTVTGPNYVSSQTQQDNIAAPTDNIFINQFSGLVEPGEYTITFTFLAPYDEYFNDPAFPNNNCEFTETLVVVPPSEVCEQIIEGCTDPTADNYDPNADVDNGSCENSDPCTDNLLNPSLTVSPTATPSDSLCLTDTITVGGIDYTSTVIVPQNNGSITTSITYTAGSSPTGINNFALLVLNEQSVLNGIDTVVDSVGIMFTSGNIPTNEIDGVTISGVGYWSPLIPVSTSATFTYTLNNLPPGNYYVIAIANPSSTSLINCGEAAFIQLMEYLTLINVGLNDPAEPCPEPCIGVNCDDYVLGCTDPGAENYSPDATYDDGTCQYNETFCEQNPNSDYCQDCTGLINEGPAPRFASGILDETICDDVTGSDGYCTDPNACNYNPDAPLDLSNNLICDYCSCADPDDPDCFEDTECDPDLDPNCQGPDPDCPNPANPDCNPIIYDPCPTGDCGPPIDPCIILGNCPEDGGGGGDDGDPFEDVVIPVEVTCVPDIESADGGELNFNDVQLQAFQCMSQEGQKMLFRMKSGAYYDDTDILKLSLIAYLFAGGINKSQLPCLFNCNYESADKQRAYSCQQNWAASGARFYNSTDSYQRGDIVVYYYLKGGKVTRNYYVATREIQPIDLQPRYFASGWHRCQDITLRTTDSNNIATGQEEYLQVLWEFMVRFCNECEVNIAPSADNINNVDPKTLKNYLDPKTNRTNYSSNSGIIGEDGEEIIF